MGVDLTTRTDLVLTWVGAAGVIAYTVYIHGQRSPFFHAFSVFALLTMAWLGWDLLVRRRADLAPMENRFTDALTAVLAFCLLLFATDFGLRPGWVPFRLGSLGGLLFVYACVRLGGA